MGETVPTSQALLFRHSQSVSGRRRSQRKRELFVLDTSTKREVTSQRIEREGLGKSSTETRQCEILDGGQTREICEKQENTSKERLSVLLFTV